MPRSWWCLSLCALLAACTGSAADPASVTPARSITSNPAATTGSATPGTDPTSSPSVRLPPGVPATFPQDLAAPDLPSGALIPAGASEDGGWFATTSAGEAIVVAYARPTSDPFRAARGVVIWRRFPDAPFWRAVAGEGYVPAAGVLSIRATIGDATGDGEPDVLIEALTGGSGTCASWQVRDLTSGTELWHRELCDAQVEIATEPAGLNVTEAVFKPGDAHCCPSATRTTVLTYAGAPRWAVASERVTPVAG